MRRGRGAIEGFGHLRAQGRAALRRRHAAPALILALTAIALVPAAATADVTIGPPLDPPLAFGAACSPACTVFQSSHPSATLAAPVGGAVLRWRVKKGVGADWGEVRLRVLRPDGLDAWRAVHSSDPVTLPGPAGVHEFATNLPISAGDRVAVSATNQYQGWIASGASLGVWSGLWAGGDLLDGQTRPPHYTAENSVVGLQADIGAPPNEFTLGKPKLNRKRGTAKLPVVVPGPGRVTLQRTKQLKPASAQASSSGAVRLTLRPRGKAKRRLASTPRGGRRAVKVRARVRFAPIAGTPRTKAKRVRLVRRG